jgi:rhodanese-related sulfurtransferase
MKTATPKQRLYAELARLGRALASPQRLELLELLAQGERSVDALATVMGLPIANVSHHLQVLRQSGLVVGRKDGLFVHYRLGAGEVFDLHRLLVKVGRDRLTTIDAIVRRYLEGRDGFEPVGRSELIRRVREGTVVVLDVRPAEEFAAGHVPGAVSMPLESLEAGLDRLPAGKPIVAYCRGPYCVMAFEAVRRLRERGLDARRLEEGFPEWRAEGLPVAVGAPGTPREEGGSERRALRPARSRRNRRPTVRPASEHTGRR